MKKELIQWTKKQHNNNALLKKITITFLLVCTLTACKEQIVHDLSETEANRLVAKLTGATITSDKVKQADGRWAIAVPREQMLTSLSFLTENRFLKETRPAGEQAGIMSSREDQRFGFERKLSAEIESTLATVAGILEARVHLNLPAVDPLFGRPLDNKPGSASVLIVAENEALFSRETIASLVAGASGINREQVSVFISKPTTPKEPTAVAREMQPQSPIYEFTGVPTPLLFGLVVLAAAGGIYGMILRARKKAKLKELIKFDVTEQSI